MLTTMSVASNTNITTITLPSLTTISAYNIGAVGIAINQGSTFPSSIGTGGAIVSVQNVAMDGGTTATVPFGGPAASTGWTQPMDIHRPIVCPASGITTISGIWSGTTTFTLRVRYTTVNK